MIHLHSVLLKDLHSVRKPDALLELTPNVLDVGKIAPMILINCNEIKIIPEISCKVIENRCFCHRMTSVSG